MQPIKAKELIPQTAARLGLAESDVGAVVKLYWKTVRQSLSLLPEPVVQIANFGEFQFKHWELDEKIQTVSRTLQHLKNREKVNTRAVEDLEKQLRLLNGMTAMLELETQRKQEVKTKRGL